MDGFLDLIEPALGQIELAPRPEQRRRNPALPKRAARYLRLSTPDENDDSIGVQNGSTGDYIDALGAMCVVPDHVFIDRDCTGTTIRDRPGLIALLEAIAAGEIDLVAVTKVNRLTRNLRDAAWLEAFFDRHGAELHVAKHGRIEGFALLLGGFEAHVDRRQFLERCRDGRLDAARRGRLLGVSAPYGYDRLEDGSGLRINEAQARIIKRITRDLDAGMSPYAVTRALNKEGIPSPSGGLWSPSRFFGDTHAVLVKTLLKGVWAFREGGELIEIDVPHLRILEVDLFDRLQEKFVASPLKRRAAGAKRARIGSSTESIVGTLRCSCGAPLLVTRQRPDCRLKCTTERLGGECGSSWQPRAPDVERSILQILRDEILAPERAAEWDQLLHHDWELRLAAGGPRRKELCAEMAAIDRTVHDGPIGGDDDLAPGRSAVLRWCELQKINLGAELAKLDLPEPRPLFDPAEAADLRAACMHMMTRLPDLHHRDVDPAILSRLRDIVPHVVVSTDPPGGRYGLRLLIGRSDVAAKRDEPDASSRRWISRSILEPGGGALRFPEVVLAHHGRANEGAFELSDEDWSLVRHLYATAFRLGLEPRLVAEAVMFVRLTYLTPEYLPERYLDVADEARRSDRKWRAMADILASRGSARVRGLLECRGPGTRRHSCARPAP